MARAEPHSGLARHRLATRQPLFCHGVPGFRVAPAPGSGGSWWRRRLLPVPAHLTGALVALWDPDLWEGLLDFRPHRTPTAPLPPGVRPRRKVSGCFCAHQGAAMSLGPGTPSCPCISRVSWKRGSPGTALTLHARSPTPYSPPGTLCARPGLGLCPPGSSPLHLQCPPRAWSSPQRPKGGRPRPRPAPLSGRGNQQPQGMGPKPRHRRKGGPVPPMGLLGTC